MALGNCIGRYDRASMRCDERGVWIGGQGHVLIEGIVLPLSKIVLDGTTIRLAHFVGRNVNLVLLSTLRDRFMFHVDAASASI